MKAYEFPIKVTPEGKLELPDTLLKLLPANQMVRVIILVSEPTDKEEQSAWSRLTTEQFFARDTGADADYDKACPPTKDLKKEMVGGEPYEYYPLGEYIVSAPGVCRGRPTFKYTRIEVAGALDRLSAGETIKQLVAGYQGHVPREALEEAIRLAADALVRQILTPEPIT
jgi:uncharacterized protein (DUF433 family)